MHVLIININIGYIIDQRYNQLW